MSIKVRYFASLKESVGQSEVEFVFIAPISARNIWRRLNPDLPVTETLLAAVNMEYIDLDTQVNDGDELAFFPPVTGG